MRRRDERGGLHRPAAWSFTLVEQAGSRRWQGWGQETALETPSGAWKAPGPPGRAARGRPQFFLVLGASYFLLLEYHSSSGTPMEGSVMTPKAAQSSCGGRQSPCLRVWARPWQGREGEERRERERPFGGARQRRLRLLPAGRGLCRPACLPSYGTPGPA